MRGVSRREATGTPPEVSIVTPFHNQGQFIEETVLSVKNQDYPNIEHIMKEQSRGNTDESHTL